MNIKVEYIETIGQESRKMRTTRGPGYTSLRSSLKVSVPTEEMPGSPWPSMTEAVEKAVMPDEMKALKADSIDLKWSYWYGSDNETTVAGFSFNIHFEDRGHAKRAEEARKVLKRLRADGVESAFLKALIEKELNEAAKKRAAEDAARQLAWMAAGIVSEASRQARESIKYDEQMAKIRRSLANHRENFAIDLVSQVSREHEVDEAELKLAVEEALLKPAFYMERVG
jgi:hypothetical protein